MPPYVVGARLKETYGASKGCCPAQEAPEPQSLGQAPFSSSVDEPRPMSDAMGVRVPSSCSGSAGPCGLSVARFSPPGVEPGVYSAHDKALFFCLAVRQDL